MPAHLKNEGVKVGFKLTRDKDGYPPADWEWLWAQPVGSSNFKIDNIPFFVKGIASGDIVRAEPTQTGLVFKELQEPSGHSTVRVVLYREGQSDSELRSAVDNIRSSLKNLGCATELSHIPNLVAVDVPTAVDYQSVLKFLSAEEHAGLWDYEEACLGHTDG